MPVRCTEEIYKGVVPDFWVMGVAWFLSCYKTWAMGVPNDRRFLSASYATAESDRLFFR